MSIQKGANTMNRQIQTERDFREFFGRRLRAARIAANLSQKGLAYHLQVGQDTISNYERGKVIPNILTIFRLSQIFRVDINYFFPNED
jgi:transcriptional regulator with XRE-family HTH domain